MDTDYERQNTMNPQVMQMRKSNQRKSAKSADKKYVKRNKQKNGARLSSLVLDCHPQITQMDADYERQNTMNSQVMQMRKSNQRKSADKECVENETKRTV